MLQKIFFLKKRIKNVLKKYIAQLYRKQCIEIKCTDYLFDFFLGRPQVWAGGLLLRLGSEQGLRDARQLARLEAGERRLGRVRRAQGRAARSAASRGQCYITPIFRDFFRFSEKKKFGVILQNQCLDHFLA
jgi:hypothetical protein